MPKKRTKKDKKMQYLIALKRINKLFLMAENKAFSGDLSLADRYVGIARKLSMKYLAPIPKKFKHRFCKHCYCYLLPDLNSRFRVHRSKLIIYCYNCKKYTRILLKKDKISAAARLK
jgi:ribonuclease P protein subunit RPR2